MSTTNKTNSSKGLFLSQGMILSALALLFLVLMVIRISDPISTLTTLVLLLIMVVISILVSKRFLVSYATLYNGYTDTLDKMLTRLDLDLYYLRNHSVLFDARVLGMTFLSIVTGKKF